MLDYILAMTKSTTTDKVRYIMSYRLILLDSSFCLPNQLRVLIRYGTLKDHLLVKKLKPRLVSIKYVSLEANQTLQTTNMNFEKLLG